MGKTKRASSHEDSFHAHYAAIWGERRWCDTLYPALVRPTRHAALLNAFASVDDFHRSIKNANIPSDGLESVSLPTMEAGSSVDTCVARRLDTTAEGEGAAAMVFPPPRPTLSADPSDRLMTHWNLDAASILAARMLDVRGTSTVLDLCAAPGGKSVALAQDLFSDHRRQTESQVQSQSRTRKVLCSNEADKARFGRLSENLKAYLPSSLDVRCTNVDATTPNAYRELAVAGGWDRVLVDAPCSSERHIIHAHAKAQAAGRAAPEMANWRPGSTKRLKETQVRLLMTALRLVKENGNVLYATCSVESGENDGVIEKVQAQLEKERKKGLISWHVKLQLTSSSNINEEKGRLHAVLESMWAERTKHGWIVLPDHPSGSRWGPLFFTLLSKVPADA